MTLETVTKPVEETPPRRQMDLQSPEIGKLAEALSKAQGEIRGAVKDSTNPFFKAGYADLASVWEAIRGPFSKNALSVTQTTYVTEKGLWLITTLMHSSGQWQRGMMPIYALKPEPQALGSAMTYARRYGLAAIAGVAQIDDDGESNYGRSSDTGGYKPGDYNKTAPLPFGNKPGPKG